MLERKMHPVWVSSSGELVFSPSAGAAISLKDILNEMRKLSGATATFLDSKEVISTVEFWPLLTHQQRALISHLGLSAGTPPRQRCDTALGDFLATQRFLLREIALHRYGLRMVLCDLFLPPRQHIFSEFFPSNDSRCTAEEAGAAL